MNHLDLFSGIGGFALAAEWMGWKTKAFCEQDKYCQKVLNENFKGIPIHGDVTTIPRIGEIDIITGGFPCQPFSVAGKKKGKEDNRYLWPAMLKVIEQEKPAWVLGENVSGIVNMALDTCITDLEAKNYTVQPFIIPACSVEAPHRRDRVWIIAHTKSTGTGDDEQGIRGLSERCGEWEKRMGQEDAAHVSNANSTGLQEEGAKQQATGITGVCQNVPNSKSQHDREIKTGKNKGQTQQLGDLFEPGNVADTERQQQQGGKQKQIYRESNLQREPRRGCQDGAKQWAAEPGMGRVVNGLSGRMDRIKGLGNAVVPQLVYQIFKIIDQCKYH